MAADLPGAVAVRDSKEPHGAPLAFPRRDWSAFARRVKRGDLDV